MTLDEINAELDARGMTITQLAKELDITADGLGRILAGKRPLTGQLSKHIEYVLNKRKQQTFVFTVDLPEGTVRRWIPGFDKLSADEQTQTLTAISQNIMQDLIAKGAATLTLPERTQLETLSGTPLHLKTRPIPATPEQNPLA